MVQPDFTPFTHGFDYRHKIFLSGRHIFEQDTVLQILAVAYHVADSKCIQKPPAHRLHSDVLRIFYVIIITAFTLAFDIDIEQFLDIGPPVMESPFGQFLPVIQRRTHPPVIQFLERYLSSPADSIHKPDIFKKKVFIHNSNHKN